VIATRNLLFICFVCFSVALFAQESESAKELKRKGVQAERSYDIESASIYFSNYLQKKPQDLKVEYKLADLYRQLGDYQNAIIHYENLTKNASDKFPLARYYYAEMLKAKSDCENAVKEYTRFRKDYYGKKEDQKYRRLAKNAIEGCESNELEENEPKSKIQINWMNEEINDVHMEGSPIFYGEDLLYNSLKSNGKQLFSEKDSIPNRRFYFAKKEDKAWKTSEAWDLPKVAGREVANGAFSPDGNRFYFAACMRNILGKIDCDIYRIDKEGNNWSKPIRLSSDINTKYTETQIAVGLDEKERETLYFVSDRKEGKGGTDIWYSTYDSKKDRYKPARNCGSKINSVGNENTPFIDPSSGKMFFSSDGHPGLGGLDVFQSIGQRSSWVEPTNIGRPINGTSDELYYTIHPNGEEGVFASNRLNPKITKKQKFCCDDLYYFKESDKIKVSLNGTIYDQTADPKKSLEGVQVKVYQYLEEKDEQYYLKSISSNKDGEYQLNLEPNNIYKVKVEKDGYLVSEELIRTSSSTEDQQIKHDFLMERYLNRSLIIENIYYKFDSKELTEKAMLAIDTTIYEVLIANPQIIVEIGSHTDSKGDARYNQNLSQGRAESVVKYLRKKGIAKNRMIAKGYGEANPIEANQNPDGSDNPEGRARNRRTEFKVIGQLEVEFEYKE